MARVTACRARLFEARTGDLGEKFSPAIDGMARKLKGIQGRISTGGSASSLTDLEDDLALRQVEVERLAPGEVVYVRQCAGCHGLAGDGSGPGVVA